MSAVLDDTFVRLFDSLCALDDETNGRPGVTEANRAQALAGLERLLVDVPALDEHIRRLQKRFGRTFRHQTLLAEERAEQVVSEGAGVLSNDELAVLLLNPIALRDLAFRIGEELPDYWLERMSEVGRQAMQAEGVVRKPPNGVAPSSDEEPKRVMRNSAEPCVSLSEFDWTGWTDWVPLIDLDLSSVSEGPGAYVIATDRSIHRAVGTDHDGFLDRVGSLPCAPAAGNKARCGGKQPGNRQSRHS
jgi:hypothetical protein